MDAFGFSTITAGLTVVAMILAVIGLAGRFTLSAESRAGATDAFRWLAWAVAAVAMAGSLIYSEVYHFIPCELCWYQRIAMYPLAGILLVGAIRRDRAIRYYGLPLSIVGLGISIWHIIVQNFPSVDLGSCDPLNPCSAKYVERFGFISIPVMAGAGFLLITVLLAFFTFDPDPVSEK